VELPEEGRREGGERGGGQEGRRGGGDEGRGGEVRREEGRRGGGEERRGQHFLALSQPIPALLMSTKLFIFFFYLVPQQTAVCANPWTHSGSTCSWDFTPFWIVSRSSILH